MVKNSHSDLCKKNLFLSHVMLMNFVPKNNCNLVHHMVYVKELIYFLKRPYMKCFQNLII